MQRLYILSTLALTDKKVHRRLLFIRGSGYYLVVVCISYARHKVSLLHIQHDDQPIRIPNGSMQLMNHDQYAQYSAQFSAGKSSLQNGEYIAAVETSNDMSER